MRFAREAWPFVAPFGLLTALAAALGRGGWAITALVLGGAVLLFFRIPARRFVGRREAVLAAADGLVTAVDACEEPLLGPGTHRRIVTFLSVFDVHVQVAPVAGTVIASERRSGRKVAAFRGDAGEVNESHTVVIQRPDGGRVAVRQIAGLVARRVVSYPQLGERLGRGQRIGLIKFGSRVDLILPAGWPVEIERGQRLRAGLTAVAIAPPEAGSS